MADSELLLQPEMLAELEQYRALERRHQLSRQQCREFNQLAQQVVPRHTPPLSAPLSDGSPAAELEAALSALRQQIRTIHQLEAQLDELRTPAPRPPAPRRPPLPPLVRNIQLALYIMFGVVLFVFLLMLLYGVFR